MECAYWNTRISAKTMSRQSYRLRRLQDIARGALAGVKHKGKVSTAILSMVGETSTKNEFDGCN